MLFSPQSAIFVDMRMKYTSNTYIWQQPDWPEFRWDAERLVEPLSRLSHLHGQLSGQMSVMGFDCNSETQLAALTDDLVSSSAIEGVALNVKSVRSSIAKRLGLEPDGLLAEDHYVEGLVNVMMDAIDNARKPLTSDRLCGWHTALFPYGRSGGIPITVGDWRKGNEPMQVVSGALGHQKVHFEAPPSASVPEEMTRFMDWCNEADIHPFIRAAIAHLWFVTIHPFDDGNGRLSRTVSDMYLSQLDSNGRYYSMSAQINRQKTEYYDMLERTQKGSLDITEWLLWFFSCLEQAINRTMHVTHTVIEKAAYWERHRHVEINERQRKVINRLWDGFDGKLTSSKWAKICHCSQDTALRDINDLIAKGMLKDSGEKGRNANYILA